MTAVTQARSAHPSIPQSAGPWNRPGTVKFYGGPFSNFAATPGLRLPEGWSGHPPHADRVDVPTVEHYFQACKVRNRDDFLWILSAPKASQAKRRGGPRGEGGRAIELRPDWEEVKVAVMHFACLGKFMLPAFREALRVTGDAVLVEDSPSDFVWGRRDRDGGYRGRNLLGVVLMTVRAELASAPADSR